VPVPDAVFEVIAEAVRTPLEADPNPPALQVRVASKLPVSAVPQFVGGVPVHILRTPDAPIWVDMSDMAFVRCVTLY
jgi:hypothetical protein